MEKGEFKIPTSLFDRFLLRVDRAVMTLVDRVLSSDLVSQIESEVNRSRVQQEQRDLQRRQEGQTEEIGGLIKY